MTTTIVLVLSSKRELFTIETDASNTEIGSILMQRGHPISFISKGLSKLQQTLFAYEKELLAILLAKKKCYFYLID